MDHELRACAKRGHATWRPDEADLADRLHVDTPAGESWRCLRCGTYVPGEPNGSGPASRAPIVLRGKALRDARILRLLALERGLRAFIMILLASAILRYESSQATVKQLLDEAIPAARPLAHVFNFDVESSPTIKHLQDLASTKTSTLDLVATLLFAYAATQVLEAVGLWLLKRWGEYVAAVVTSAFLPLEIYELTEKQTGLRIGALLLNVVAVVYLVWSKRLFGIRGGGQAYEAERHSVSLLEVEQAALTQSPADRLSEPTIATPSS